MMSERDRGRLPGSAGLAVAVAVGSLAAMPAWAQQAPVQVAANTATPPQPGDGEILVTARRRAEDPQKVPIALSVFGGAALERQNIFTIDQLQRQAPSLQIIGNNPRNTNINIRGLGANIGLQNDGLENGVGVYVDDVYYARTGQAIFDLVDIDRIELLRGPQGTLFGKNTTAGALSIYTRAPSFKPDFSGDASVGSHGNYQVRASIGGPIIGDSVAGRFSIAETTHGAYLHDTFNGKGLNDYNNFTARGQILAKLGGDVTLRLIGDYGRQHEDGYAASSGDLVTQRTVLGADGNPVLAAIPNGLAARIARTQAEFPGVDLSSLLPPYHPFSRDVALDGATSVKMKQGGASAKLDWTLPDHVLTAITAWRFWDWNPRNDADGTPLPILTNAYSASKQRQFSQEVRLASSGERKLNYVIGGYYFHQTLDSHALTSYGAAAPIWLLGADNAVNQAALNGFAVTGDSTLKLNSYAAFGQATWNITSRLSLTGGLRYTRERKVGSFVQTVDGADLSGLSVANQAIANATRAAFGAPNAYDARTSENKLSGQANLAYRFSDEILGYATYSHGFKSGGLTLTNVGPTVPKTIAPETVENYEIGLKTRTADHVVTLNLAAFWTIDKNYQATIYDPIKTTTYVANVGKVRSRGVEAEAHFDPFKNLTTYASITYLDATYLSFKDSPCPIENAVSTACDLSGRRLPGAPKWTAAAGGEYSHPVSDRTSLYVGGDFSYRSAIFYAANLAGSSRIPGYALVNARLGARIGDHLDVSVWARNLFNKGYFVTLQPAAFNTGLVTGVIGDPRVVGVTARVRY